MTRTTPCAKETAAGRLAKAEQFMEVAEMARDLVDEDTDVSDAIVTLYVHAGIAAADVICCHKLGAHAQGQSHAEAVELLKKVDAKAAGHLRRLLSMKTKAGYGAHRVSATNVTSARRSAEALLSAANGVGSMRR